MVRSQGPWMFLAAALFGYFGFFVSWSYRTTGSPPQTLVMVVLLMWSLRGGCIAFAIAGALALAGAPLALLLYSVAGIVTAIAFVAVAIWDVGSAYFSGVPPLLLFIFAAWNGYSSVQGLRDWRMLSRS